MEYLKSQVRRMESPDSDVPQNLNSNGAADSEKKQTLSPKNSSNTLDYQAYNTLDYRRLQGPNIPKMLPEQSSFDPRSFPSH